jgi:hypothetical protein
MGLRCGAVEGGSGETFLPCQRPTIAKLLFRIGLRCAEGVALRPADLARGHSSPPPEVPREMALVRKTSRQGYFRQRSMCLPQQVFHMFQAPPQQIRVRRHPH